MTQQEQTAIVLARREHLQREINSYKIIPVDRSIYTKTKEEKQELHKLKTAWKNRVDNGYEALTYIM